MMKLQRDEGLSGRRSALIVLGLMALLMPLVGAMVVQYPDLGVSMTLRRAAGNFFGGLVGFVIGCGFQAIRLRTPKRACSVIALVVASIALVMGGVVLNFWLHKLLGIRSDSGLYATFGLVFGAMLWADRGKVHETHATPNDEGT